MQPIHRFHLGIPAWDLLLIGCQAPGLFSGRPPQEMGARPQGILLEKLHQKWVKGPRASFLETKNNPKTIQKNPENLKKQKEIFGEKMKKCLFLAARMPLLKEDAHYK